MYQKHILICDDDLKIYSPIVSNINVLLSLNVAVTYLGFCSDKALMLNLVKKGLNCQKINVDKIETSKGRKFLAMFSHTNTVLSYLKKKFTENYTLVWVFGNENGWRLNKVLEKYKSIFYLFVFPKLKIPIKYRLVFPFLNLKKSVQKAWKVFCCEYNREQITKSFFDLDTMPTIIPNKSYMADEVKDIGEIGKISIGKNVWVGNNVAILKNTYIGNNSIVATGAVVKGTFADNVILGEIPVE